MTVVKPNVSHGVWNAPTPRRVVAPRLAWVLPPLSTTPRQRGTTSADDTASSYSPSARLSGATLWKPTGHLRRSCGSQSTSCWDAGNFRPVQQSASMTLTGSSRTKSARSDRELLEHQSRRIQQFGQVHHCLRSPPYRLPTSRRPSRNCRTKALPLTHCQCRR